MAGVFVDIPGIGQVEAKNAASEATLKELLKAMQAVNRSVSGKGGAGAGGGAGSGAGAGGGAGGSRFATSMNYAAKAGQEFGKMGAELSKVFTGTAYSARILTDGSIKLVKGFGNLAKAGAELARELADVGDSLTNASRSLNNIPVIGGVLSSVLGAVASAAESVSKSMKEATGTGASFGGSLSQLSAAAGQAGMTIEQFGAFVKSNGEAMSAFGTTTDDGAKRFARISSSLRQTSSELFALGYGTADINQGLANYGKLLRTQGAAGTKSNNELIEGSKKYLKEMDLLAKVTGEERAAKEKEREALAKDAQFRAAMAGLGPDVEESAMLLIQSMPHGPMRDFAKDILATGTVTTEQNRLIASQFPQVSSALTAMHQTTQRGVKITKDQIASVLTQGKAESQRINNMKTALAATTDTTGAMTEAMVSFNRVNTEALKTAEEQQAATRTTTDGQLESVEKAKSALAELTNSILMQLATSGGIGLLMSVFTALASFVTNFVLPGLQMLIPILQKVWYGMTMLLQPVMESLTKTFGGMGDTVSTIDSILNSVFTALNGAVRGAILIFESLMVAVDILSGPFNRLSAALFGTEESATSFGSTLIEIGNAVGQALEILAEILGWVIDTAIIPLVTVFREFLMPPLKELGNFILDNLTPTLVILTAGFVTLNAAKIAQTIATIGLTGALGLAFTAMSAFSAVMALSTSWVFLLIAGITAAIAIFHKFGGDFEVFFDYIKLGFYKVLDALPGIDYTKEIKETSEKIDKRMAENRQKREELENKKTRNQETDRTLAHKEALQKQELQFRREIPTRLAAGVAPAVGQAVKEELGKPDKIIDYNAGPEALLKQFADKQSTLTDATAARKSMEAEAEKKKIDEAKAAAEAKSNAEAESKSKIDSEKNQKGPASETPTSLLAELNSKMARLIQLQAQTTTNTYETVVAAKGLSKDLFRSV